MLVYHRTLRAQHVAGPLDSPLLPALLQQRFAQPQPQPQRLKGLQRRQLRHARSSLGGGHGVSNGERHGEGDRRASYEPDFARGPMLGAREIPIDGSAARDTLHSMSMAALVRESRSRAHALRGAPSRTATRQRHSSARAKTPDHYDSALWHALPDDVRRDISSDKTDERAASWFADGPETFERVGAATNSDQTEKRPARDLSRKTSRHLGSSQRAKQLQSDSVSGISVGSDPLAASREFHERILRLTATHKEQERQAHAEAAEYTNRGGVSLQSHSNILSHEADSLQRAEHRHRSEMALARAEVTAKYAMD